LYPILLHRDGAQAVTYGGAHGDPSPPYTGRSWGGGTRKRERTRSARSRDLLHHPPAWSRDNTRAERGGDTPRHRSRDTSFIGGELRALGLTVNTNGIRTFLVYMHGRPIYGHDNPFLLIARLILIL